MNLSTTHYWIMDEVQEHRDYVRKLPWLGPQGQWVHEAWTPDADVKLVGARFILLVGSPLQNLVDVLSCITLNPEQPKSQMDLKKNYLFYGQRDAYARSQGVSDLIHFEMFPCPYGFEIGKGIPIYAWVMVQNFTDVCGMFDVGIDLFWVLGDEHPAIST